MLCESHPLTQLSRETSELGLFLSIPVQIRNVTLGLNPLGISLLMEFSTPPPPPDSEVAANSWLWISVPVESKAPFHSAFCPAASASNSLLHSGPSVLVFMSLFCFCTWQGHYHTDPHDTPAWWNLFIHTYNQFILLSPSLCSPCPFLSWPGTLFNNIKLLLLI